MLLDGDLLESALLSPVSFAEAEAAVLAATSGPDGVLVASVVWEADAVTIRVAVRATQLTDELVARTWEVLDHQLGVTVGFTVAAGAPALVLPAAGLALLWTQLPPDTQAALQDKSLDELQEWLVDHPELVQHLANGGGGLLEGLWDGLTPVTPGGPFGVPLLVPDTESAAGLLAALYGDGHAPDDARDPRHPRLRHRARGPGRAGATPRAGRRPGGRRRRGPDDQDDRRVACGTSSTCRGPTT